MVKTIDISNANKLHIAKKEQIQPENGKPYFAFNIYGIMCEDKTKKPNFNYFTRELNVNKCFSADGINENYIIGFIFFEQDEQKVTNYRFEVIKEFKNLKDAEEVVVSKNFLNKYVKDYKTNHNKVISFNTEVLKEEINQYMQSDTEFKFGKNKIKVGKSEGSYKQIIFHGAPGTGKTYTVLEALKPLKAEGRFEMVQFHPSYDYTDFVEGLRPVILEDDESNTPTFVRMDGAFKAFCRKAANNPDLAYYFFIDEINRADLGKVFGELMFGLEESYRGKEHAFKTQYQNLITYEINKEGKAVPINDACFKDGFYVPENVVIIGTMNDIDRSVDSMDFAMRRRFQWFEVKANDVMKSVLDAMYPNNNVEELTECAIKMNITLSTAGAKYGLSEAYHIGPAYFKKITDDYDESLKNIFEENISNTIRMYLGGRSGSDDIIDACSKALGISDTASEPDNE